MVRLSNLPVCLQWAELLCDFLAQKIVILRVWLLHPTLNSGGKDPVLWSNTQPSVCLRNTLGGAYVTHGSHRWQSPVFYHVWLVFSAKGNQGPEGLHVFTRSAYRWHFNSMTWYSLEMCWGVRRHWWRNLLLSIISTTCSTVYSSCCLNLPYFSDRKTHLGFRGGK